MVFVKSKSFPMVLTAMFACVVCVANLFIQIPLPTGGYANLGDSLALMSGFILGPLYGGAAAGIGSALADIITGYVQYVPGTLAIKTVIAIIAALAFRATGRMPLPQAARLAIACIPGECAMVLGYQLYDWFCLGYGAGTLASLPGNLAQGAANVLVAMLITPLVIKSPEIQRALQGFKR